MYSEVFRPRQVTPFQYGVPEMESPVIRPIRMPEIPSAIEPAPQPSQPKKGRFSFIPGPVKGVGRIAGGLMTNPIGQMALFMGAPMAIDAATRAFGGGQPAVPERSDLEIVAGMVPPDDYQQRHAKVQMELAKLRGYGMY
jgi:hypothetical protein